jgi:uncharacterized membrane protein
MGPSHKKFYSLNIMYMASIIIVFLLYLLQIPDDWFAAAIVLFTLTVPGLLIIEAFLKTLKLDAIEKSLVVIGIGIALLLLSRLVDMLIKDWNWVDSFIIVITPLLLIISIFVLVKQFTVGLTSISTIDQIKAYINKNGIKGSLIAALSLIIIIMIVSYSLINFTATPKEKFTEFYVLNEDGHAYDYPTNISTSNPKSVIIGVANHEGRQINYTVEAWLVDYTFVDMAVNVTQMYFVSSFSVILEHMDYNNNDPWQAQYEVPLELNLTVPGNFSLFIMLFQDETEPLPEPLPLDHNTDYSKTVASWRIVMCVNSEIEFLRMNVTVQ